jgi:methylglutaconyl-CoA hydratase
VGGCSPPLPPDPHLWYVLFLKTHLPLIPAPLALRAAKKAITFAPQLKLDQGLDLERSEYNTLIPTSDRLEGLKAFAEKRRAVFTGK